jgi:hypothetical protein
VGRILIGDISTIVVFLFSLENSDISSLQAVAIKDGRRMNEKKHKPLQFVLL